MTSFPTTDTALGSTDNSDRSEAVRPLSSLLRVLIVDDQAETRWLLQGLVEDLGLLATTVDSGAAALAAMENRNVDLVLTDLKMPGMSGLELLHSLHAINPQLPVVVCTAYGTVSTAVEAMKLGAFDFILKPFDLDAVRVVIRRALRFERYQHENEFLRAELQRTAAFERIVGTSTPMQPVFDLISQVAPTGATVLITGETGTGKELVARAIHNLSPRRDAMFVPLNCAAVPSELLESELFGHVRGAFTGAIRDRQGKFAVAAGGTLFLDEIGDMPYPLQAKLLRVLQEAVYEPIGSNRTVKADVRLVSSTNRNLKEAMESGSFRADLYYRLNVVHIEVPPLRERPGDVEMLACHYIEHFSRELGRRAPEITNAALEALGTYHWPGNVRELRNLIERAVVLAKDQIHSGSFPALQPARSVPSSPSPHTEEASTDMELRAHVARAERDVIRRALEASRSRGAKAARLLGISERTLSFKLRKYKL